MRTRVATAAGSADIPNEDLALVAPGLVVVLDGVTSRTSTGCRHGVPWYVGRLAGEIGENASLGPRGALAAAIRRTAERHRGVCDLEHAGTPSSAVAIVQIAGHTLRYLVLGDVTIAIDLGGRELVVTDDRVAAAAPAQRAEAQALPVGSAERAAALVRMKRAEQAGRNTPGGYWIAANDPVAAAHAVTGEVPLAQVRAVCVLTDGAARLVDPFRECDWGRILDMLAAAGPAALIARVRSVEALDPLGRRWPRNKMSDDATAVYCNGFRVSPREASSQHRKPHSQ